MEAFTPDRPKLRFRDIVEKTMLPKATVFRFLHTLVSLGYVKLDDQSKVYSPGPRVMSLGFAVLASLDLRDVARPYLEELSRDIDQTVNLGILDKTEVVYIERVKKRQILNTDFHMGSRLNAYLSSIGRAILAFLPRKELDRFLIEVLKNKEAKKYIGSNGEKLLELLQRVRQQGYALNDEELYAGLRAAAAPVFGERGIVEGAINLPVFSYAVSHEELIKKYVPPLVRTAQHISMARGFIEGTAQGVMK